MTERLPDAGLGVVLGHRLAVGLVGVVCAWGLSTRLPQMDLVPADFPGRLEVTYLYLGLGAYSLLLSVFLAWKVGGRREGRTMALTLASIALLMTHLVAPTGELTVMARVTVIVAVLMVFWLAVRLWTVFPQTMDSAAARTLLARGGSSVGARLNRLSARTVVAVLESRWAPLTYYAAVAVFAWRFTRPGSFEYSLYRRTASVADEVFLNGAGFPAVLVTMAFAWTAFRLADADRRNRVLWIVLTQMAGALWVVFTLVFGWLDRVTGSAIVHAIGIAFLRTYPFSWLLGITGFAIAIFHSGAMDLRPIINKTTVYGSVFMLLTFLFAGVEELIESQVAARLGVSEGAGTWIAAAFVAVAVGPVRAWTDQVVKRVGSRIEPAEPLTPARDGVPGPT